MSRRGRGFCWVNPACNAARVPARHLSRTWVVARVLRAKLGRHPRVPFDSLTEETSEGGRVHEERCTGVVGPCGVGGCIFMFVFIVFIVFIVVTVFIVFVFVVFVLLTVVLFALVETRRKETRKRERIRKKLISQ